MSEPPIRIRQGTLDDYPRAARVLRETFEMHLHALPQVFRPGTPPPTRDEVRQLLHGGSGALWVAEHKDDVVGCLTVSVMETYDRPYIVARRWANVDTLGIATGWRGQGIGRSLMQAAEQWATSKGATQLQLTVWEFNTGAREFYDALGYTTARRTMWKDI